MHITKRLFLAAAMAAGLVGSAYARTITVTENKTNGVTTSVDLTFSADSATHSLWMAYGKADGGYTFDGWENVRYIGEVAGNVTSMQNVSVPDGWGNSVYRFRFFLVSPDAVPVATLDYIEATGTQYVKTSFMPTGTSAVEMSFAFDPAHTNEQQTLFCARKGYGQAASFSFWWEKSRKFFMGYHSSNYSSDPMFPGGEIHAVCFGSGKLTVDGTNVISQSASDFASSYPLWIFALHNNGTSAGNYGKFKLYSFQAWADGSDASTIALDLVPCRKKDGTACLYDKANHAFLENAGSGSFVAGSRKAEADAPDAASGVVTVSKPGWIASNGDYFSYDSANPLYVVDVAAGVSNAIDQVTFKEVSLADPSVTNDVPYATFIASSRNGTILKRGGGTLTFDKDLSTFTGPVHVEDGVAIGVCSNCFGQTTNAGHGAAKQNTYVHSGATLVMDAIGNRPQHQEPNAVLYEGDGYPGMGGAYLFRNGNTAGGEGYWQPGSGSLAVGPTRLFVDIPSGAAVYLNGFVTGRWGNDFSLNGQDVLLYGREVGSIFGPKSDALKDIGNLVVSNITLTMNYNANAALLPKNGSDSSIRFCGGSRWLWHSYYEGAGQTATLYIDDLEYASFNSTAAAPGVHPWGNNGSQTRNWYRGPVVLNGDFRVRNELSPRSRPEYSRYLGCTFSEKVSGTGGFRQWYDGNGVLKGDAMRINLLYSTNTFEGGIVLAEGSLGVYGEKAVPSHADAGNVVITNGYVYFGRVVESAGTVTNDWVDFTMPVTEFSGNCAVTNGTGAFQGLVKKGTGTLDYNSQMGGDCLDLQGGTVAFNTQYRSNYVSGAPSGYVEGLPAFTTLKGTVGTLDLANAGGAWTVANIEGSPTVTNGNLTVTGAWRVDASAIGNPATIHGTLEFGPGATVTVTGDLDSAPRQSGGFLLAKASAITGSPQLVNAGGWLLSTNDGELRILSNKPTVLSFR